MGVRDRMLRVEEATYQAGLRQARHAHERATVSMVLTGGLRERVGSREEIAGPLSVVVKPAGTEHQDDFGSRPTRLLRITLDLEFGKECARVARHLAEWRWHPVSSSTPAFLGLLRRVRSSAGDGPDLHDAASEVLAAIAIEHAPRPAGSPPQWLEQVWERVTDLDTPTVAELARGVGVHPVYLARQFRRWYGSSIREHRRHRRAQRAAKALTRRPGTISAASYDAGFADHAHMCRTLKRVTGQTPAAIRSLLAGKV